MVYRSWYKKGAFSLGLSPYGGGGLFHRYEAFLLPFSSCEDIYATFFYLWGGFFHNLKAFLLLFFHVGAFLQRLSPYGGLFLPFKGLSATFFSMWGPFCYVFLLIRFFFQHLKALLLLFPI